jgi:hypothetical protein
VRRFPAGGDQTLARDGSRWLSERRGSAGDAQLGLRAFFLNYRAVLLLLVDMMLTLFYTVGSSPLTILRRKVWTVALWSAVMLLEQPF